MIVCTEEIEKLKPYIDNIEELVKLDDVQLLFDVIDDVIIENMLSNFKKYMMKSHIGTKASAASASSLFNTQN